MAFSTQLLEKTQRKARVGEAFTDSYRGLTEPFVLEKLYKPTVYEIRPGVYGERPAQIQPHQRKVHEGVSLNGKPAKAICFTGGVGSGKSVCLCVEIVKLARTYPGIKIVATTAYDWYFDMFLMPTFWGVFPEEDNKHKKSYNVKSRLLKLVNGSQIQFKAFEDANRIKGWDAHVIWIEEASELGDGNNEKATEIYMALTMRLRSTKPPYPLRIFVTQNPKGHNWVWKVFIKDEPGKHQPDGDHGRKTVFGHWPDGSERSYHEFEKIDSSNGDIFYTVATSSYANQFLPAGYIDTMLGAMADNPAYRQRMVEGLFTPINTLVYDFPLYSERTHLVDYEKFLILWEIPEIPPWWPVLVGIDCGGQLSPWAIEFYAQVPDGTHWVCFDEIYIAGPEWNEICERIKDKTLWNEDRQMHGYENIRFFIDPISSAKKEGPTQTNIQAEFLERGIYCESPKGYSKGSGIERVRSFLVRNKQQPCPYDEEQPMQHEDGAIHYENGCAGLYYLTNIPWKRGMMNAAGKFVNPEGHAAPGNIAEKRVYRRDASKQRPTRETEEGLTPYVSEKVLDRDDHAQTAEMFAFLGQFPMQTRFERAKSQRQETVASSPQIRYGTRLIQRKHRTE